MIKICKYCGEEFETDRNYQKYCSKSCYNKDYRKKHQDYYREYFRQYHQDHKDRLREYHRKYYMRCKKEGIKDSQYPCFEYIGHYVDKIPSEMCLNCSAPECRFYND